MLDHVGIRCADFARSLAFFQQALAPLGISVVMQVSAAQTGDHDHAGFGRTGKPDFWIGNAPGAHGGVHVAFSAGRRADVDAFHRAALAAGGTDNGAPGIREHYHPDYYGAFVLDPDGNNIEAVCHHPG
ncbi:MULTISPECIES: VOC family protein [Stenotrophomonas]|jgi:catechol 2,3-dioxygenase-like lactoylglutathione lyase family enzyme|uniref:VOC family protein n=1 Tax=Stenotrophomonas TaxID=40323 RepID=UPI001312A45C|nr:VOC family protein [Stenotrophomonas sp.]MDX3934853.1 VOC family protein [Stenotrophomonas sp.]